VTRASLLKASLGRVALLAATLTTAACTIQETPPPTPTGPSEFAISLSIAADPDLIPRDGSSKSSITVTAKDPQGAPVRLQLRLDMAVNNVLQDFGSLSKRTLFTNSDGHDTAVYTAPPEPPPGASAVTDRITIVVTPVGTNAQGAKYTKTTADIRLVPKVITTPGAPVAFFTYAPSTGIKKDTEVRFNASGSYPMPGSRIVNYAWDWGDGTTGAGAADEHDWAGAGAYPVTLTVTDDHGQSASTTQMITVG
jgi:PKD repeat protein